MIIQVFLVKPKQSLEFHAKKGLDENPLTTQCGLKLEKDDIQSMELGTFTVENVTCKKCRETIKNNLSKLFELLGDKNGS
jgi:hypothetical protein